MYPVPRSRKRTLPVLQKLFLVLPSWTILSLPGIILISKSKINLTCSWLSLWMDSSSMNLLCVRLLSVMFVWFNQIVSCGCRSLILIAVWYSIQWVFHVPHSLIDGRLSSFRLCLYKYSYCELSISFFLVKVCYLSIGVISRDGISES